MLKHHYYHRITPILLLLLVALLVSSIPVSADMNTSTYTWYYANTIIPELQRVDTVARDSINITIPNDAYGKVLKYIALKSSGVGDEVPKKKIKLAAVGDISCNNILYKRLADSIKQYEPDKVLLLGDYSYRLDDARCFTDVFSFPADKVIAVHGNHDNHYWDSKHRPTYGMMMEIRNAYNIHIPGSYYKYHNVAFITIDNSLAKSPRGLASIDEHSVTYALARYNLSMAKMDDSIDWRIVLMHIPLNVGATDAVAKVREPYAVMMDDAGVDIVLSGDTHHYTRTYPIKGINSVVSRDKSSYDFGNEGHGRIQYIIGTGGADQSSADEVKGIVAASIGRERLRGNPAYLQIEITNDVNNTTMKSRLVDINGNIYDEASISKKRGSSKQVSIEEVYLYVDGGMVKTGVVDDRRFFDGSDGRMAMLNHDDRMNGKRLSIALWFLSESKGSNRPAVLIEKGNPVIKANISFLLGIDSKGSIVYEWDGQDGKRYSLVSSDGKKKDHHYADGRWHHLAVVRDGASVIMYIDGIPVASGEFKAMPVSNEYDIYINAMPDYSHTAKAMIDAIGVWDRALSAEEVLALYHGDDSAREDAIVYEGFDGEGKKHVFTVYAGESLSMRWYGVDGYGRGTVIVLSNGIYMQPWQSISIFKASTTMNGAHGAMYHEAFFGSSGL